MTTHQLQYNLIKDSRHTVLHYCSSISPADYIKPVPQFGHGSICSTHIHIADIYLNWIAVFALKQPVSFLEGSGINTVEGITTAFQTIDNIVYTFLHQFEHHMDTPITGTSSGRTPELSLTPNQVFTHVITHEFHHKGQIMTMSRMLGYTPIDTDIIRFS